MATPIAWLLNLDAERELQDPERYTRAPAIEARIAGLRPRMEQLLSACDCVLGCETTKPGARALAFCPTPSALARIRALGLTPPLAPPLSVLTRVNSRAFSAALGQTLAGAAYVRDKHALTRALASGSPSGAWLLKRDYSFAGRERRRVLGQTLDIPTLGFCQNSFARGEGLQVEPLLERSDDFAQHGFVTRTGALLRGPVMRQHCDARGTWERSEPLSQGELDRATRNALQASVQAAGEALLAAGYFGPYGVDAFRYREPGGSSGFQPRSEINARFSMGYPRELLERALALDT
jgi:hypothetical protein